jgi:hypothetical protein
MSTGFMQDMIEEHASLSQAMGICEHTFALVVVNF